MLGRLRAPCLLCLGLVLTFVHVAPSYAANGSFWLRWTATGDDGNIGRAARYDVRVSQYSISGTDTVGWWNAATIVNTAGKVPPASGQKDSVLVTNVTYGRRYYCMMRVADEVPNWSRFSNLASFVVVTAVESDEAPPPVTRVQAAPNPFVSSTSIQFSIPQAGPTEVVAYDVAGRLVRRLHHGIVNAGPHVIEWDGRDEVGRDVRSGIYFIRIRSTATTMSTKAFRAH